MFLQAYNELMKDRDSVIEDCIVIRDTLADTSDLERKAEEIVAQMNATAKQVAACVRENAQIIQTQEEYMQKYNALEQQYDAQKKKVHSLQEIIDSRHARVKQLDMFIETLRSGDCILEEWDAALWMTLVESGTVLPDGSISFTFKDGTEILAALK